jgi:hypothetical protein
MTLAAPLSSTPTARRDGRLRRLGLRWNATAVGFVLAVGGWSAIWGQAVSQVHVLPPGGDGLLFFAGLGLAAVDQRRKARLAARSAPSNQEEGELRP